MQCPRCGTPLDDPRTPQCPRCGLALSQATDDALLGQPSPAAPSAPGYGPPTPSDGSVPSSTPTSAPTWNPPPYGYGAPSAPSMPAGHTTAPGMPPYGPPTGAPYSPPYGPPSQYNQPPYTVPPYGQYGQAAPPSLPLYAQAAPPQVSSPWQAQGYPLGPQSPYWAPPPPAKKRTGTIIILAIVAVIALLGLSGIGLALYRGQQQAVQHQTNTPVAGATSGATPSATATPTANVIFQDHFADSSTGWPNDSHCSYGSGGYHINGDYVCLAPTDNLTDASITTGAQITSGSILYGVGVAFRVQSNFDHYEFDVDGNGKWSFLSCSGQNCDTLVDFTANAAIHKGLNASNTLQVTAKGSHFTFYVNSTQVGDYTDSKFASGECGLTGSSKLQVVYDSFVVTSPR